MFVTVQVQNSWDQLQIDDILCWRDNILPCPKEYLRDFRNRTVTQLTGPRDKNLPRP